jgi:hypothetical protein
MPWYSSVKLYRQRLHGEWKETLASISSDLDAAVAAIDRGSASAIDAAVT